MSATRMEELSVLHVDDEPEFAELTQIFLERETDHISVEIATDATEALNLLTAVDIDCIVSDYDMPGPNGIEFLETIREHHPELPFILFTGKGSEEVASDAISAGVTDYLQKESGSDQYTVLSNRIDNAVARYRAEQLANRAFRAMDRSREGIALLNERGEFIYVNDEYRNIVGYDEGELIGAYWEVVYPEEQARRIHEEILDEVPEEGRWTGETVYQRKDGSRVPVEHELAYSETGTMICFIRDQEDISAQQSLREEGQRFDLFVDAVEDYAIFMLDPDGYITSWNRGAERIKGYAEDDILGEHFSIFYTDEQIAADLPERLLERAVADGSVEHQGTRVRQDGTTLQADVVITAVFDEHDEHRGFGKVTREIELGE